MLNETYQHKHLKHLYCEIIDFTKKGYKVTEYDFSGPTPKTNTRFYEKIWFDNDKGVWTKQSMPAKNN